MTIVPVALAILSAALFGAATPASKLLLAELTPLQLAGLLYLGAAVGVAPLAVRGGGIRLPARGDRRNRLRLAGAVLVGGVAGPVLLLLGLRLAGAAPVSLWLNLELVATALLGVLVFREHLALPGCAGVACALAGAALLSFTSEDAGPLAGALVLLACVCWGVDNHLTALIDGITPSQITFWKGAVAGTATLALGLAVAPLAGGIVPVVGALFVGVWAYGASIVLSITAARAVGATRTQIAFASAPFFGVVLSVLVLGEALTWTHVGAGLFFAVGVALLFVDRHSHAHAHDAVEHEHRHRHDDGHHDHQHPERPTSAWHTHRHRHDAVAHAHPHWPDLHHRHRHAGEETS